MNPTRADYMAKSLREDLEIKKAQQDGTRPGGYLWRTLQVQITEIEEGIEHFERVAEREKEKQNEE